MDFKSMSLNRAIALSFTSRLIRRLTIVQEKGGRQCGGCSGGLGLPIEREKKSDMDIIFGKHNNSTYYSIRGHVTSPEEFYITALFSPAPAHLVGVITIP